MEICKSRTEENTAMRILERDLAQTSKALSNLLKAIESGIFTESIKQRLEELEAEKRALQEKILIEQSKELYQLTEKDVEKTPAAWSETKAENDDRPSGRKDWRIQRKTRDHFAAYAADAERYTAERHN